MTRHDGVLMDKVERPSIPLLFFPCLALCCGAFLAHRVWEQRWIDTGHLSWLLGGLVLALIVMTVALFCLHRAHCQGLAVLVMSCIAGMLCFALAINQLAMKERAVQELQAQPVKAYLALIADDPRATHGRLRSEVTVIGIYRDLSGEQAVLCRTTQITALMDQTRQGEIDPISASAHRLVKLTGTFVPSKNTGELQLRATKVTFIGAGGVCSFEMHTASDVLRVIGIQCLQTIGEFRHQLIGIIDPFATSAQATLAAMLCGYTSALKPTGVNSIFATCGLSHILAVSGTHLAIIMSMAGQLIDRSRFGFRTAQVVLALICAVYVIFTALHPSALRAGFMLSVLLGARWTHRRYHAMNALAVVSSALVITNPSLIENLGFLLSATSVFGIITLTKPALLLAEHIPGIRRIPRTIKELLILTCAAQLATLPITAGVFGLVSLVAPLVNLIAVPLLSVILVLGMSALVILSPVIGWQTTLHQEPPPFALHVAADGFCLVGEGILHIAIKLCEIMILCAQYAALLPAAAVGLDLSGGFIAICLIIGIAALWIFWYYLDKFKPLLKNQYLQQGVAIVVTLFVAAHLIIPLLRPDACIMLDIGQGDAIALRDGHQVVLIDTGPGELTADALRRNQIHHINALIITHFDHDHVGGIDEIAQIAPIATVYIPHGSRERFDACLAKEAPFIKTQVQELKAYDQLECGDFTLTVLAPNHPVGGDKNADSIIIKATHGTGNKVVTTLFTGDAETPQTLPLAQDGIIGKVDILKVGHHGSKHSASSEEFSITRPQIALISCGRKNRYGHPHKETLTALQEQRAVIYRTDIQGDVTIHFRGGNFWTSVQHESGA